MLQDLADALQAAQPPVLLGNKRPVVVKAKVPIVKCWDPVLSLACDINVNNPLALENTRMIRTYVQLDDRVRPLAKIIKYWTKRRLLNDAGKHNLNPPPERPY